MSNNGIRRDKHAEIERSSNNLGKDGEQHFTDTFWLFLPQITGFDDEFYQMHRRLFRVEDISQDRKEHDFLLTYPRKTILDGQQFQQCKVEVKTRNSQRYDNVVLETWQDAYTAKYGKARSAKDGWFITSSADWYIFVHQSQAKDMAEVTCISASSLHQCVIDKHYDIERIPDGMGIYAPIKDLKEYRGQSVYISSRDLGIFDAINKATEDYLAEAEANPDAVPLMKGSLNPLFKEYLSRGLNRGEVYIPLTPSRVTFIPDEDASKAVNDKELANGLKINIHFKQDPEHKE